MLSLLLAMCATALAINVKGPFPAKEGENCVVCGARLDRNDVAYLVDGQRVAVAKAMEAEFLSNPLQYVTKVVSSGPVVTAAQPGALGSGYVWLGVFCMIGLMSAMACAQMAAAKGLAKWPWFVLGLCFSVPAVLALAAKAGKKPAGGIES